MSLSISFQQQQKTKEQVNFLRIILIKNDLCPVQRSKQVEK